MMAGRDDKKINHSSVPVSNCATKANLGIYPTPHTSKKQMPKAEFNPVKKTDRIE